MKHAIQSINANGLEQIRQFLLANAKNAERLQDANCPGTVEALQAWAREAEFQLGEGNPASIELKSYDSSYGWTQTFDISDEGIDTEYQDDGCDPE